MSEETNKPMREDVTQADREMAAWATYTPYILSGVHDDTRTVQAFARHRLAQRVAPQREDAAVKAATVIRAAFFTSVSGEKPHRYHLSLAYPTMEAMHEAEDVIKAWAKSVLEPES